MGFVTALAANPRPLAGPPFHVWKNADGTPWLEFYRRPNGILLRFPQFADFEVSADGLAIGCQPFPDVPSDVLQHLYLNQVYPLAASARGMLAIHASAVALSGAAVAFMGVSGRGKSTLAASFALAGFPFVTDDGLMLQHDGGRFMVQPSDPSIRLWPDSETELLPHKMPSVALDYTDKLRFPAGHHLQHTAEPLPLLAIYFLGEGTCDAPEIARAGEAEAFVELARHSFQLDVEDRPALRRHFDALAALSNRIPCFHLDYPRRFDKLPAVRHAIVEHAGGV